MFNYFGNHISFHLLPLTVPLQHPARSTLGIPVQDGCINHELLRTVVRDGPFALQPASTSEWMLSTRSQADPRARVPRRHNSCCTGPATGSRSHSFDRSDTATLIFFERRALTGPPVNAASCP